MLSIIWKRYYQQSGYSKSFHSEVIKCKSSPLIHVLFLIIWRFSLTKRASSELLKMFTSQLHISVIKNWYYCVTIHPSSVSTFHNIIPMYGGKLSANVSVK